MKRIADAFVFSREGRVLEGMLAVADLERLHDLLVDVDGEVSYSLQGLRGRQGELMLRLQVGGEVQLACQRCLQGIPFAISIDGLLELVPEGAELSQDELEDDTKDYLPLAGELNVAELVEDEILLSLPVAPRHEDCGLPGAADAGERINPFAALAGLKGKPN